MRERDPQAEREEITEFIAAHGGAPDPEGRPSSDAPGRPPPGPAPGWRRRERRAESCDRCEGDLWVEGDDGEFRPCPCRAERRRRQTARRLRAAGWLQGPSPSFERPPLTHLDPSVRNQVDSIANAVGATDSTPRYLWLQGPSASGKSTICDYLARRTGMGGGEVIGLGDLLLELRRTGAESGEGAVEERMAELGAVPLLVIDDLDRAVPRRGPVSPLAMRESPTAVDLLRAARIVRDRLDSCANTLVTSTVAPTAAASSLARISGTDLMRALLAYCAGQADPIEDSPEYVVGFLESAFADFARSADHLDLRNPQPAPAA